MGSNEIYAAEKSDAPKGFFAFWMVRVAMINSTLK